MINRHSGVLHLVYRTLIGSILICSCQRLTSQLVMELLNRLDTLSRSLNLEVEEYEPDQAPGQYAYIYKDAVSMSPVPRWQIDWVLRKSRTSIDLPKWPNWRIVSD